jgi:hypothetical protein
MFRFKKKRLGIDWRSGEDRRCNSELAEKYFSDSKLIQGEVRKEDRRLRGGLGGLG